jgi:hypothetical protein
MISGRILPMGGQFVSSPKTATATMKKGGLWLGGPSKNRALTRKIGTLADEFITN